MLIIVQSVSRMLESSLFYICQWIFRLIFVTVDVDNSQDAFNWLVSYLAHLHTQGKVTTWGTLSVLNQIHNSKASRRNEGVESSTSKSEVHFVPGAGLHFLRVGWFRYVVIHMTRSETAGGRGSEGAAKELLWLGTFGWNESFFRSFIEAARVHAFQHDEANTIVYVQDGYHARWKKGLTKSKRSFNSVILDDGIAEDVFKECQTFLASKDWYAGLGVPYRRSFLLESPPGLDVVFVVRVCVCGFFFFFFFKKNQGCGKSSFISALAGRLNFDICFLSLSASDLTDQELAEQLRNCPPESITVLEELDAAFPDRTKITPEEKKKLKNKSLTLGGLLNALDGLVAAEGKRDEFKNCELTVFFNQGRIVVFTTNHLHRLDEALMRPGRVDRIISLRLASSKQIEQLFLKFHPQAAAVARLYARSLPAYELSMAQVQGHLLRFRNRPVEAVSDAQNFVAEVRDAARRRKEYENKLKAEKKKKKNSNDSEEEEETKEAEPEAAVAAAATTSGAAVGGVGGAVVTPAIVAEPIDMEKDDDPPLSQSVQSLSTTALEMQVNEGLRKRRTKKKKKSVALNQTK